jgi:hypothetical protein
MVTTRDNPLFPAAFNFPSWRKQEYANALKRIKTLMLVLQNEGEVRPSTLLGQTDSKTSFLKLMPNLNALRLNFQSQLKNRELLDDTRRGLLYVPLRTLELGKFSDMHDALIDFVGQYRNTLEELVLFRVSSPVLVATNSTSFSSLLSSPLLSYNSKSGGSIFKAPWNL